jgi:hypothetical protein
LSYDAPSPQSPQGPSSSQPPDQSRRAIGRAAWSLALGILGLLLSFLTGLGAIPGIIAVYLGWPLRNDPRSRAKALTGLITGGLSVVLVVVSITLYATGVTGNARG